MHRPRSTLTLLRPALLAGVLAVAGAASATAAGPTSHTSGPFRGAKANAGTVTHAVEGGRNVLTLSADFKVPDAPAPHWQVVDREGNAFLLNRLVVKGDRLNRSIALPDHVRSIAKVQIWCAWAEALLGEAAFDAAIELPATDEGTHVSSSFAGVKANTGFVTHLRRDGRSVLMLSGDFVVPDTPAPHWQVVDATGRTYLLQRLDIKDGRHNLTIAVPAYVPEIAKVQIWCAWAETLLGEAAFEHPVR